MENELVVFEVVVVPAEIFGVVLVLLLELLLDEVFTVVLNSEFLNIVADLLIVDSGMADLLEMTVFLLLLETLLETAEIVLVVIACFICLVLAV